MLPDYYVEYVVGSFREHFILSFVLVNNGSCCLGSILIKQKEKMKWAAQLSVDVSYFNYYLFECLSMLRAIATTSDCVTFVCMFAHLFDPLIKSYV